MLETCAAGCVAVSVAVRGRAAVECEHVDDVQADVNVAGPIVSWDQMDRDSLDELDKKKTWTPHSYY